MSISFLPAVALTFESITAGQRNELFNAQRDAGIVDSDNQLQLHKIYPARKTRPVLGKELLVGEEWNWCSDIS